MLNQILALLEAKENGLSLSEISRVVNAQEKLPHVLCTAFPWCLEWGDALGRLLSVLPADYPDNPGVSYTYDTLDRLKTATYGSATTTITYDRAGRKTYMSDSDMGAWSYAYDGLGSMAAAASFPMPAAPPMTVSPAPIPAAK